MMTGKITRALKLRLEVTEIRNLTIRNVPWSGFSPQESKNGLRSGPTSRFFPRARTVDAALCAAWSHALRLPRAARLPGDFQGIQLDIACCVCGFLVAATRRLLATKGQKMRLCRGG